MLDFLKGTPAKAVTLLLLAEAAAYYAYPKNEIQLLSRPLKEVPRQISAWTMEREVPVDTEVEEFLKADDTLNRIYSNSTRSSTASLWIAFFKTQRTGVSPHSPKVCLPGSGWTPSESSLLDVSIPGMAKPITINRYVVSRGGNSSIVLYWYQTHNRAIASEYAAKVYTVIDGLRYRRSDTSMVRVIVPAQNGDLATAQQECVRFIQDAFPVIKGYLPK